MKYRFTLIVILLALGISTASAQLNTDLQDRLDQKPNTTKVDIIILTGPDSGDRAASAVRNANGNVSHDFNIIDGVAVTIPKMAAENLADRDFVREIQPDYDVETRLDTSAETVNAPKVWEDNNTGEGVDVAVLDTGVEDDTILDVQDQVDYTGEGTDDLNGHGTHVAGIVASTDNQYGGVAYNADILDVKVLNQDGTGSASDVIEGLEWSVENGAEVATLSLGAQVSECDGTSAISEAVDNTVDQGIAVTVAAGNNGPESQTITAPGCARGPITVGSSNNGEVSDFSSRGPTADGRVKPDMVAPGEGITSLSNNNGSETRFETLSGTSMATPHAAGAAALLLSENEDLEPGQIKNITKTSAEDLGFDENDQGNGLLDAYEAYQQITKQEANTTQQNESRGNEMPIVESLGVEAVESNGSLEAEMAVNATDQDNETLSAEFYFEGEQVSSTEGYGELTHTESNLSANTTYTWRAEASDGINTSSTGDIEFTLRSTEEGDKGGSTRRNNSNLPPQASETARKATGGFFNPNSPFYGVDLFFDRASVAVGLRSKESVMEERAMEVRVMSDRGNERAAQKAIKNLRDTAGNNENATKEAQQTLEKVMEGAPEEAKKGLSNALGNIEKDRKEQASRRNQRSNGSAGEENRGSNSQREGPAEERAPMNSNIDNRTSGGETDRGPQRNPEKRSNSNTSGEQDKNGIKRNDQQGDDLTEGRSNSIEEEINSSTKSEPSQSQRGNSNQESSGSAEAEADAELDAEAGAEASSDGVEAEADAEAQGSANGNTGYDNVKPDGQQQPETSYGY